MKWEDLEKLVGLMKANDLEEVEIEDEEMRLRVKRYGVAASLPMVAAQLAAPAAAAASAAAPSGPARPAASARAKTISSPFVGTFYRSPSPDADAFVQIGQTVRKGQTLCIVEAMKLMNEIEAEIDGKILDVLHENGQPVEFGQGLFVIEPL